MGILNLIQAWGYPAIECSLLFYSLIKLRGRGGEFFAAGFATMLISSLTWRGINIFHLNLKYENLFMIMHHINFVTYVIFAGFIFTGIYRISKTPGIIEERGLTDFFSEMPLKQVLFSFQGRISRGTFWGVWSALLLFSIVTGLITGGISSTGHKGAGAAIVINIACLIPIVWINLAIQVKRWHDIDKSGWMVLINLIPLIGIIWTLIELGFFEGTKGPNRFDTPPLETEKTMKDIDRDRMAFDQS